MASLANSACQCGHQALRGELADDVVVRVGDKNTAVFLHRDSKRAVELSVAAVAIQEALLARARECRHPPLRCDLAYAVVVRVGHDDIPPVCVHTHSPRAVE
eukprot:5177962-Pyramimonas_sp.AAC.2